MSSEQITQTRWQCDGLCGTQATTDGAAPIGWLKVQASMGKGENTGFDYVKMIDLCASCSKDAAAAVRRWEEQVAYSMRMMNWKPPKPPAS